MWRSGRTAALLLAAVAAVAACDDDPIPPGERVPTTISITPDTMRLGFAGASRDFTAIVYDQAGAETKVGVTWSSVDESVFTVAGDSVLGTATAVANGTADVIARAGRAADTATVVVEQIATRMEVFSGDGQDGLRDEPLAEPVVVRVTDEGGTPAAGIEVAFTTEERNGTVSDSIATTGADGLAAVVWTLGDRRMQRVTASHGLLEQRFSATAFSDPPTPDYAVAEDLEFTRIDPLHTDTIEIRARITNLGDGAGPATFPVRLTLDGTVVETRELDRIEAGATGTVTFTAGPFEVGEREVGVEVDAGGGIVEWEEENNTAGGTLWVVRQTAIPLNTAVTLQAATPNEVFLFRVEVPETTEEALNIALAGGAGDADIFGHFGERPGYRYRYRCFSVEAGTSEHCQMVPARAGTYHIAVHAFTAFEPATLTVTLGGTPVEPFDIELVFLDGGTDAQRDVVREAAARWESVIARDVVDWDHGQFSRVPAGTCGLGSPAVSDVVDDIRVFVTFGGIDGIGLSVARAGPCWVRPYPLEGAGGIWLQPTLSALVLDLADLPQVESEGMLEALVTHQMAHALGFAPEVWRRHGRLRDPSVPDRPNADTHFDGRHAVAAFDAAGGAGYTGAKVPVENGGLEGVADMHWREGVFGDELMSALITGDSQPLSLVTIESLYDIGYEVNPAEADAFSLSGAGALGMMLPRGAVIDLGSDALGIPVRVLRMDHRRMKVRR